MKSANASFGGPRQAPHDRTRSSQSLPRLQPPGAPASGEPGALPRRSGEPGRWARCDERPAAPAPTDEPRTGVVRRVAFDSGERQSGVVARSALHAARALEPSAWPPEQQRAASPSGDWRCLEWGQQPARQRRPPGNSKVTIVQLSHDGDLLRQNGPDTWVPEAGDFVQRMARLVAQGLGFQRCRSVCLKGGTAALTITEASDKVVAVSGPLRSMANVLRRAGLES